MLEKEIFQYRRPVERLLLDYGFVRQGGAMIYSTRLLEGQFELTVAVSAEGEVSARLVDAAEGGEYVLHRVPGSSGAFVGKVRAEFEAALTDICQKCFEKDVFRSEGARRAVQYVRRRYQDELEFLWERFPANAVWRRKDNGKWYGVLMAIPGGKLGMEGDETVEILDLRIRPEELQAVLDGKRYFPGYHMNKQHWFTICLDGRVPEEELQGWIDQSYALAAGGRARPARRG